MERGPLALFGAIVAVGLGPALWLGAQFGSFDAAPTRSPVPVDQQHSDSTQLVGGSGAGENETGDDSTTTVRTTPRAHGVPLTVNRHPSPSVTGAHPSTSPPARQGPASSSPTADPSPSPSQPTDPSGDGGDNGDGNGSGGDNTEPPSPPGDGSGTGGGGTGGHGGNAGDTAVSLQAAKPGKA